MVRRVEMLLSRVAAVGNSKDDDPIVRVSTIPSAGMGLFAGNRGHRKGDVVCLYPGTVYCPGDAGIFACSIRNNYVLRTNQGYTIDGKPHGLSRIVYRSAERRDSYIAHMNPSASTGWLGHTNALLQKQGHCFGHVVNCSTSEPNLMYVEYDLSREFVCSSNNDKMFMHVPNVMYSRENMSSDATSWWIKGIGMFALQDIKPRAELFVDYHFIASAS